MIGYMSFCPSCKSRRELEISVGPDHIFNAPKVRFCYGVNNISSPDFEKAVAYFFRTNDNEIKLHIEYGNGFGRYDELIINIDSYNSFYVERGFVPGGSSVFYIYLQSQCRSCDFKMYSVTSDIDFKVNERKLSKLQMEEDCVYTNNTQISFDYPNNSVRLIMSKDILSVPMWEENFSDKDKFTKRIKTILTFG